MLRQKHLAPNVTTVEVLEYYDVVPELIPLNVTEDTSQLISVKLTGTTSPGGNDTAGLQQYLLHFGIASQCLQRVVASLSCWMAKSFLFWAAICAPMSNCLIAL